MREYFPEPKSLGGRVKVELDLFNYARKTDLEKIIGADTSDFTDIADLRSDVANLDIDELKNVPSNLSNLKSKVDKIDVDKLVPVPVDLSKLSNFVKSNFVIKDVYNAKTKDIEDKIATNTTLNAKVNEVQSRIPSITNLVTNAPPNTKINEVKNKICSITNLATLAAFNVVENKTPNHSKYISTPEFNELTIENFTARLKQVNIGTKCDITDFVKKGDFNYKIKNLNKKITSNKSKHLLVENEQKKLQDKTEKL